MSVTSTLSFMPKLYNDIRVLPDAARREDEHGRPIFFLSVDEHADVFRVAANQAHSVPFLQTDRWLHCDASLQMASCMERASAIL